MDFCKDLPKLELHAHLNGSLSEETLRQLNCKNEDILEYQTLKNTPINERNLDSCFKLFRIAHNCTKTPEAVYLATKNVIQEFSEDNVVYLELRTTPRSEGGMSSKEYIKSVVKAISENENDIIVKLLLSINREHSKEKCEENLEIILDMHEEYPEIITGIDLCGNPSHGKFSELEPLFKKARHNGLSVSLHCGEINNNREVYEMLKFGPERIGHGTFIHPNFGGSAQNFELLKEFNVHTEFCLTSNIICGTRSSYLNHHIRGWMENSAELSFSLNTDDKGVFYTTLSEEYQHFMETFNVPPRLLWEMNYDNIDHIFARSYEKEILDQRFETWKNSRENVHYEILND